MRTRSRSFAPFGLRSGHIPRAKESLLTERCWKIVKMYASIQDVYSTLLHIKDGRCRDFLACHDVGYQHANFQKYRTCDKTTKRYLFESTFFLGHQVWPYIWRASCTRLVQPPTACGLLWSVHAPQTRVIRTPLQAILALSIQPWGSEQSHAPI